MTWITPYSRSLDFGRHWTLDDKVRIYEERTLGWQLGVADTCINSGIAAMRQAGWAALMIVFSYFEEVGKMEAGFAAIGESRHHFDQGVIAVFPQLADAPDAERRAALTILYSSARCGFYHTGMAQRGVFISGVYPRALQYSPDSRQVFINPHLLTQQLVQHCRDYIERLREPINLRLRENFEARFDYLLGLDPLA